MVTLQKITHFGSILSDFQESLRIHYFEFDVKNHSKSSIEGVAVRKITHFLSILVIFKNHSDFIHMRSKSVLRSGDGLTDRVGLTDGDLN